MQLLLVSQVPSVCSTRPSLRPYIHRNATSTLSLYNRQRPRTVANSRVSIQTCSDKDKIYSVLLPKAEASSRLFSLDAAQKHTDIKAMVAKVRVHRISCEVMRLALQMNPANSGFYWWAHRDCSIAR